MKLVKVNLNAQKVELEFDVVDIDEALAVFRELSAALALGPGVSRGARNERPIGEPAVEADVLPASAPAPASDGRKRRRREGLTVTEEVMPPNASASAEHVALEAAAAPVPPAPTSAAAASASTAEPAPAAEPASRTVVDVPPVLLAATGFRQVLTWMLDNGVTDAGEIERRLEAMRAQIPALQRLSGSFADRIVRGLVVLNAERGVVQA